MRLKNRKNLIFGLYLSYNAKNWDVMRDNSKYKTLLDFEKNAKC